MKLFKFLFFISMLVSLNSPARERTPDEMRQEALNVLISKHPQQRRAQTLFFNDLKELKRMDNLSIVGLEDFGFAVISHDDCFDAVLGYSFTPLTDTLPCGFEWWLETANESMRTLSSTTTRSMKVQRANSYPSSVEPLLTSRWSQNAPYNDKCRVVVKGKTYTCPTGCVATAFAQVLNYYKYPVHGVGSYSYTVPYTTWGDIEYSANFENSTYDWNNMLDDYSQGYTTVQADAVATLMHDCGIAVAMEYGTKSSSAFLGSIETAIKRFFSFNYAKYSDRYNYSNDEWLDILYDELAHGRPILYDGFKKGSSSGHAFVVDGYDGSGLFHINWGWGGKQDGYFDINVLNGYSIGQEMVIVSKEIPKEFVQTATLTQAGTLPDFVSSKYKNKIVKLKIKGAINGTDILYLREMAGCGVDESTKTNGNLSSLDLSEASIVAGGSTYYTSKYSPNIICTTLNNVLGKYTFYQCSKLTSLTMPPNVTSIGGSAFEGCSGLKSIIIPKSVTDIGQDAFLGCEGLTSVTIPNSVISIAERSFSSCNGLIIMDVEKGNTKYDSRNGCNSIIETATNTLVAGCKNSTIPNGVKTIGNSAFYNCCGLTSMIIPNSVTSIGNRAFMYCNNLKSVTLGNSVTTIGHAAFFECSGLNSLNIPNSVLSISTQAFTNCRSLSSLTIPISVTYIGGGAFDGIDFTSITSFIMEPFNLDDNVFNSNTYCNAKLIVPNGTKDKYKVTNGWKNFINIYEVGEIEDTRSEQTMELAALPVMTYGDAVYLLPDKTTEGLKLTWNIDDKTIASVNGYQLTILKAGSTTITAYQEGNDSYKPFTKEFSLTINKGNLKIIANNATKIEGMENPELSVTYEGFKYNDNELSLTTKPTVTTTATMNSPVGTYPILVSGALSDNYTITYVNGILTILAKEDNEPTSYCVVIEIDGGEQTEYALTENPKLSFDGKTIILTTTKVRIEYSATDIAKVALKDISTTDIEGVEERQRQIQLLNDKVHMSGLVAHETVQLYSMGGVLLSTWKATNNGELTINLSDLQRGVYIIKANHQSFKVTRK